LSWCHKNPRYTYIAHASHNKAPKIKYHTTRRTTQHGEAQNTALQHAENRKENKNKTNHHGMSQHSVAHHDNSQQTIAWHSPLTFSYSSSNVRPATQTGAANLDSAFPA